MAARTELVEREAEAAHDATVECDAVRVDKLEHREEHFGLEPDDYRRVVGAQRRAEARGQRAGRLASARQRRLLPTRAARPVREHRSEHLTARRQNVLVREDRLLVVAHEELDVAAQRAKRQLPLAFQFLMGNTSERGERVRRVLLVDELLHVQRELCDLTLQ